MAKEEVKKGAPAPKKADGKHSKDGNHKNRRGNNRRRRNNGPVDEFEQRILDLARVTRVTAGGKRMRFRACVVVGDKKGKVGVGLAKGSDVTDAINKAVYRAKRDALDLSHFKGQVPHEISLKYKAAKIFLKPGRDGNGIIAGGVLRSVLELSGFADVTAKMYGSGNKINNAKALIQLFATLVPNNRPAKKSAKKDSSKSAKPKAEKKTAPKKKAAAKAK